MKAHVLMWYITSVVLVATAIGAFGMLGPWLIGQPDSLMVLIGFLVYIVGIPVVGFGVWSLVQSIMKKTNTEEEVA